MTFLLFLASVIDLLLAGLLVAMAGNVIELGGDPLAIALWAVGLFACIAAPIGGLASRQYGNAGRGVLIAFLPVGVAIGAALVQGLD